MTLRILDCPITLTPQLRSFLARAYGLAGDDGSARATYREVLGLAPRCYFALHDLALLDLRRQPPDVVSAERNLLQAVQVNPRYVTGHRKLAVLYEYGRRRAVRGVGDPYYADQALVQSFLDAAHHTAGLEPAPLPEDS